MHVSVPSSFNQKSSIPRNCEILRVVFYSSDLRKEPRKSLLLMTSSSSHGLKPRRERNM